jgi:hypothetical protein
MSAIAIDLTKTGATQADVVVPSWCRAAAGLQ